MGKANGLATCLLFMVLASGCEKAAEELPTENRPAPAPALSAREQRWQQALSIWRQSNPDFLADPSRAKALDRAIAEIETETNGQLSSDRLIVMAQERAFRATNWDVAQPDDWQKQWNQVVRDWSQRHTGFLSSRERTAVINSLIAQLWPNHMSVRPEEFMAAVEDEAFRRTKWRQYAEPPPTQYYSYGKPAQPGGDPKAVRDFLQKSLPADQ